MKSDSKKVLLTLSKEVYQIIHGRSEKYGLKVTEYIRDLVKKDVIEKGVE